MELIDGRLSVSFESYVALVSVFIAVSVVAKGV